MEKPGKQLMNQDWDHIIQDFGIGAHEKWTIQVPRLALLEQALFIIVKREHLFKSQLLAFIEESSEILISDEDVVEGLSRIVEALRALLLTPTDGLIVTALLKEQMMVSATVVMVVRDGLHSALRSLEALVELLLSVINRPNHSVDRQIRGVACECLRELEKAYPCLLHACAGHILFLCQSERTHVAQNYTLLMMSILCNLSLHMYTHLPSSRSASFLSTASSLVPFSVPVFLLSSKSGEEASASPSKELTPYALTEFRKVLGFLLDRRQFLTPCGLLEFVSSLIEAVAALNLQGSLLKIQFLNLMHTFDPLLHHALLMIFSRFSEAFDGDERIVFKRLVQLSNEPHQPLLFRLLGIHWLMGLEDTCTRKTRKSVVAPMARSLYPLVFDPLMLKVLKLDLLAYCTACAEHSISSSAVMEEGKVDSSRLFKDGLICLSAYKWLPSFSTETRLMFRMIHRFITIMGSKAKALGLLQFSSSALFKTLQGALVSLAFQLRRLVPSVLGLVDRLLLCDTHHSMGELLLETLNKDLLNKTCPDKNLPYYFPIFERIAENGSIPPGFLIKLLTKYIQNQAAEEGQNEGEELWFRGTQALDICRTVIVHHQSSRVFHALCGLLSFLCLYYPDIEVRDNARIFLRMHISIPGNKLRAILKYGDSPNEDGAASKLSQVSSLLPSSSPTHYGVKESLKVASCIGLARTIPLLVKQSWSIVLRNMFQPGTTSSTAQDSKYIAKMDTGSVDANQSASDETLQRYFSAIPDFEKKKGMGIQVQCRIKFQFDEWPRKSEVESPKSVVAGPRVTDSWPALFAVLLSFSTSGPYWPIPPVHIPFLLSEPADDQIPERSSGSKEEDALIAEMGSKRRRNIETLGVGMPKPEKRDNVRRGLLLENVAPERGSMELESESGDLDRDMFHELFTIELSPKLPMPTLIDCYIEASNEDGISIRGQLDNIPVGIEDLFEKVPIPPNVSIDSHSGFAFDLYNSLWKACSRAASSGSMELFLDGSSESIKLEGYEAVKILDVRVDHIVDTVEHYLAPFVVCVSGSRLVAMVKESWSFQDIVWKEDEDMVANRPTRYRSVMHYLPSVDNECQAITPVGNLGQRSEFPSDFLQECLGSFCVLVFLPPRFHLLFKMEISDLSTRVWIKTDHLPCLLYVDEYLEALAFRE